MNPDIQEENGRPRLKLKESLIEKILGYVSLSLFLFCFLYTYFKVDILPDFIPMHYNKDKIPDARTLANTMYAFVFYNGLTCVLVSSLARIPHQLHYFLEINYENAAKQYELAKIHLKIQRIIAQIFLINLEYELLFNAESGPIYITYSSLYIFALSIMICLLIYYYVSKKLL